jgi:hypothetical protein
MKILLLSSKYVYSIHIYKVYGNYHWVMVKESFTVDKWAAFDLLYASEQSLNIYTNIYSLNKKLISKYLLLILSLVSENTLHLGDSK